MDPSAFATWLAGIRCLDASQRQRAFQELTLAGAGLAETRRDDAPPVAAMAHEGLAAAGASLSSGTPDPGLPQRIGRERLAGFGCPHCGGDEVHRWGQASGKPRYRCRACHKTFNPLTGTPLSGLHYPDRWPDQARALIEGETLTKAAARCRVDYTTAFRWRHRFLKALAGDKPSRLSGIVEADETFILESFKGKRHDLPRKARKRGGKASKRGLSAEQIPVMVARDRAGAATDAVLPRLDAVSITAALGTVIAKSAELCCDGGSAIKAFARRAKVTFHVLPAPGKPLPEAPDLHINNVNAYHGRLKEWMRRFHGVATVNLPHYLGWRRTIEALGENTSPEAWIMGAAGMGPYQQASQ